jgi:hypothetical protein
MKTLYFKYVLVVFCFFSALAFSEEAEAPLGEIRGKVVDGSSQQPVSFASIALYSIADSSLVTGVISNDNGEFQIGSIPYGTYNIKVSYLGYETKTIDHIELSRKTKKLTLEDMLLKPALEDLEEVAVVTERLKGEEKVDRTVFTINDDIRKASTSGIDMLKHIPSVTVDFQENVTVEGQTDFQFYVDGVLRNKEFIAQLSPEDIDKVELITNPGVKYDADISAIINIVMKKSRRAGVNGSVLIPATHPEKIMMNPRANIEYGNKKFRIYAGDRLHFEKFSGKQMLYTRLDETNPNPYTYTKNSEGSNSWQNNYLNYGIDFFISERSSLNFLGEWERQSGISKDYTSIHHFYENNILTNYYETSQDNKTARNNNYLSTFYRQKFATEGNEITAEISYYTDGGRNTNEYYDSYFDPENTEILLDQVYRSDLTKNLRNTIDGKLDYTFMIKKLKNETGIKLSELWMNNELFNTTGNEGEIRATEQFDYTESRRAGYYNVIGTVKKINWQAGIRGEYSRVELSDTLSVDFTILLPQFSLSRSFEKGQNVKLSFRRKLLRPYIQDLNPFVTWNDSLHVRVGNPNLKPALENRLELSYAKNFGNNYLSPKLYLRYTKNGIQDLSTIDDDGITVISRANIGEELEYGLNVNAAFQFFKIWRINANTALFNRSVESEHLLSIKETDQKLSFRVSGSTMVQLPKGFSVFVWSQYNSPNISYQREFSRDMLYIFGFEKEFSEKAKLSVWYNPFISDFTYTKVITQLPGYYEEWAGSVDVQHLFSIEFTYAFNYGGKVNKIDRTVEYEKGSGGGTF